MEIEAQKDKNDKLQQMMKTYEVPTVDVYIELKLSLERIERREDQMRRKKYLRELETKNRRCKSAKEKQRTFRPSSRLTRKPTEYSSVPGRLFHGKTFNIVYNPENVR